MNIDCIIERAGSVSWTDDDGTRWHSDWGREPYFRAVGGSVRLDPAQRGGGAPYTHFRLYPIEDVRDFEGDSCMLAIADLQLPQTNVAFYPMVEIIGFVDEIAVAHEIGEDPHEGGNRYTPENDRAWTASLVRVTLRPAGDEP